MPTKLIALIGAAVAMLSLGSSAPALAAEPVEESVQTTFAEPTTLAVKYGEHWEFPFAGHYAFTAMPPGDQLRLLTTGLPSGYVPLYQHTSGNLEGKGVIRPNWDLAPLPAGTYTFAMSVDMLLFGYHFLGSSAAPATLVVERAPVGIEVRAVADSNNPDGLVVTSRFTGDFADQFYPSSDPRAPMSPAGTWTITLAEKDGTVATERTVEIADDADLLTTTFYWADAEPETTYDVTATFAPTSQTAQNFDIVQSGTFNFTADKQQRPVATSTAAAAPSGEELPDPGFGLPLWLLILTAILGLGLAALTTLFTVRAGRTVGAAQPMGEAVDAA